jgi:DNA-binding GntR family transcriptional regulator
MASITKPDLNLVRSPSLSEQVADSIVEAIASGVFEPGQRIVETAIAHKLAVSRVPVREAVKTLLAQGILEASPQRRTRVAALGDDKIDQICEIRIALEKIAAKDAATVYRAAPERLRPLDLVLETMERAARERNQVAMNKADIAFHHEICLAADNELVLTLWSALARHITIIFGRELLGVGVLESIVAQHRELRQALVVGGRQLDQVIERHILRLRRPDRRRDRQHVRASRPSSRRESVSRP